MWSSVNLSILEIVLDVISYYLWGGKVYLSRYQSESLCQADFWNKNDPQDATGIWGPKVAVWLLDVFQEVEKKQTNKQKTE